MFINSVSANCNTPFKATISDSFLEPVGRFLDKRNNDNEKLNFISQVDNFKQFGSDDIIISYKVKRENNEQLHSLIATKNGKSVVLSTKDQFRKLYSKFMHINEYEFNKKTENLY